MGNNKNIVIIVIVIIALVVLGLNYKSCQEEQERLATSVPSTPQQFEVKSKSSSQIEFTWKDTSENELGFRIFRDEVLVANITQDVESYIDYGLSISTTYEYSLVSYNNNGESPKVALKVKTNNYSLTVWLDKIGVIDNGEDVFRELFGGSEIYIGIVVNDGVTAQKMRLPSEGFFHLPDRGEEVINRLIFSTNDIGSYLKINIIGFEHDSSGLGDDLLIKALDLAVKEVVFGTLGALILDVARIDFTKEITEIGGFRDDYLGEYSYQWLQSDNWGAGHSYQDIHTDKEDGLRLWFTIKIIS